MVLATVGGKDVDWVSPESGALVLVLVACGIAFVWRERHAAEPFVPLRLFQNPVLRIAAPVNFTSGLIFYLGVFFLPVFFQEVAGVDATESGLLLIPLMIGTALATAFAGRRVERTGRYRAWPIVGGVVMTVGVLALTTVGLDTAVAAVAGMGAIVGIGIGCAMQTSILAVQNAVDLADMGMGTSTAILARTLGGTVGTPLLGAVLAAGTPGARPHRGAVRRRAPVGVRGRGTGRPPGHPVRVPAASPGTARHGRDGRGRGAWLTRQPVAPWRPAPRANRSAPASASPARSTPRPCSVSTASVRSSGRSHWA